MMETASYKGTNKMSNAPANKVGEAAGIYKMASSLGSAFGVAISAAVYGAISAAGSLAMAATAGIIVNVIFGVLSILSIIMMVHGDAGKAEAKKPAKQIQIPTSGQPEPSH
jgi:DHA2 family multidrug resistance protein-like MFS transporter